MVVSCILVFDREEYGYVYKLGKINIVYVFITTLWTYWYAYIKVWFLRSRYIKFEMKRSQIKKIKNSNMKVFIHKGVNKLEMQS